MAKKEATIDESGFTKQLVDAGMPQSEAKERVATLISKVKEVMAGESIADQNTAIMAKVREKVRELKSDKFNVVVVAAFPREDSNDISRRVARKMYNNDPGMALAKGVVKEVEEGTPTALKAENGRFVLALDTRDYLDKAGKIPNKKKGQPYPVRMQSKYMVVSDGSIGFVYGDVAMEVGGEYTVYGKVKENSMTAYSDPVPRLLRKLTNEQLYDAFFNAAKESDIAMDANGALETDIRGFIIVKGTVQMAQGTSNGGALIVLNSDVGKGLSVMSPFGEEGLPYIPQMQGVSLGGDVLIVGRVRDSEQYGRSLLCYGVVQSAKVTAVTKALNDLKDVEF
jgi:hypothetical protein